jgi:hypothetical protein
VHGADRTPLEQLLAKVRPKNAQRIAKIALRARERRHLLADLEVLGVTRSSLFPEPESVGREVKEQYYPELRPGSPAGRGRSPRI